MSPNARGSLFAICSGFLYGFIGFFGLSAIRNSHLSVDCMLFWRFFIATLVLLLLTTPQLRTTAWRSRSFLMTLINGMVFYGGSTLLYFYACQDISSGLAMVFFFTYPLMVMLIRRVFYQQKIAKKFYSATGLLLTGLSILGYFQTGNFNYFGIALAFFSGCFYAGYICLSQYSLLRHRAVSPMLSTFAVSLGCTLSCFGLAWYNHQLTLPTLPITWVHLTGIGIFSTVIPIFLLLKSLQWISSEKAAILSVLEPVFVLILGIVLLGEQLHLSDAVGISLILTGTLVVLLPEANPVTRWQKLSIKSLLRAARLRLPIIIKTNLRWQRSKD